MQIQQQSNRSSDHDIAPCEGSIPRARRDSQNPILLPGIWDAPMGSKNAHEDLPSIVRPSHALDQSKRRRWESNPRIRVLQTPALPLGYVAMGRLRGAGDGIRTHDLLLGKETFYH